MSKAVEVYQATSYDWWVSYLEGGKRFDITMNLSIDEALDSGYRRVAFSGYPLVYNWGIYGPPLEMPARMKVILAIADKVVAERKARA